MGRKKALRATPADDTETVDNTTEETVVESPKTRAVGSSDPSLAMSMSDASKLLRSANTGSFRMVSEAREFRKSFIYTGLLEMDIVHRLSFGSKIQILGDKHAGKSLLTYIIAGAAQRTCRVCRTPIITFYDDWTESDDPAVYTTTTCMCGKKDPMRVVLFDYEVCCDPPWASMWGMNFNNNDVDAEQLTMSDFSDDVRISADATMAIARTNTAEKGHAIAEHLMRTHAADLIIIDSLATMYPNSRLDGKAMIGDSAKSLSQFIKMVMSAQAHAFADGLTVPTLLMTNQWRVNIGGHSPRPGIVPKKADGGMGMEYGATVTLNVKTKYNEGITGGHAVDHKFGNTVVSSLKDKDTGGTGKIAQYRTYVGNHAVGGVPYGPGDTNEGAVLFSVIKEIGAVDPRWYHKEGANHIVFGRQFSTAKEINWFLTRPDINYQCRFLIGAKRFPISVRMHLPKEIYGYNPYKHDPILKLIEEAGQQTGRFVEPRQRLFTPVMRGKPVPTTDQEQVAVPDITEALRQDPTE